MKRKREKARAAGHPLNNLILRGIPADEFQRIEPHLQHVALRVGDSLHNPARPVAHLYFLNSGLASLLVDGGPAKSVEIGIAGREGLTGVSAVAGLRRSIHRAVVQIPGDAFRISVSVLATILASTPVLAQKANLFAAVQSMQFAQTAACNRLHHIGERLARWLLMTADRVGSSTIAVTHDFLSIMLGTDRPSVTESAISLQDYGAIRYARGSLRILNRRKLESRACECYRVLRPFNRALGLA